MFSKATKAQTFLRLLVAGPSGSGKTYTALRMAHALASEVGGRIALVDTERGSASKYAGDENPDGGSFDFDVARLDRFAPEDYMRLVRFAGQNGYKVLVIDGLSHAWFGDGGILSIVDAKGEGFAGWRIGAPKHREFVEALLSFPGHLVATARTKTEWVMEQNSRGKTAPRRAGVGVVQKEGLEYEFDIGLRLDVDHRAHVDKTRCAALDGWAGSKPGAEFVQQALAWLQQGRPVDDLRREKVIKWLAKFAAHLAIDIDWLYQVIEACITDGVSVGDASVEVLEGCVTQLRNKGSRALLFTEYERVASNAREESHEE